LGEHGFEDVQAQLDLAPVLASVRATEVSLLQFFAHNADATTSVTVAQGNRAQIAACTFELVLFHRREAEMTEPTAPTQAPPAPAPAPPSPNAGWAVATLLFFWPLSFSAFSHAFNVYPLWASGNIDGAQYASDRVRRLGQLSLWIFGGLLLLFLVLYIIVIAVFIAQGDTDFGRYHHYRD
jgi:hypothetical protein